MRTFLKKTFEKFKFCDNARCSEYNKTSHK